VAEASGVLGVVLPIEGWRARDNIRVLQDSGIAIGRKIRARLKQQDAAFCFGAQSRRKNRAGRAATYDNDVECLFDYVRPRMGRNIALRHLYDLPLEHLSMSGAR
jgi:hypothetical protein